MSGLDVVSGTAGLISLGINVCQGLIWYYNAWGDWESDVRDTVQELEETSNFLELVKVRIDKLSQKQADVVLQSNSIRLHAEDALKRLNGILDQCQAVSSKELKARVLNASRRMLYPFRQSTLQEIAEIVRRTRQSLANALEILQIDLSEANRIKLEGIKAETGSIRRTITDSRIMVGQISQLVEPISRIESSVTVLTAHINENSKQLGMVEDSISGLATTFTSALSAELQPLRDQFEHLESSLQSIALASARNPQHPLSDTNNYATSLQEETEQLQLNLLQKPSALQLACRAAEEARGHVEKHSQDMLPLCSCRIRQHRHQRIYRAGNVRVSSTMINTISHSKDCPFRIPWIENQARALAVEYLSSTVGRIIQLGFNISRGAGGFNLSPFLSLRRLVRRESPVFDLFKLWKIPPHSIKELGEYFELASTQMLRHFCDGTASPYDVDVSGCNVLYHIINFVRDSENRTHKPYLHNLQKLIHTCVRIGVPLNELLGNGTLLDYITVCDNFMSITPPSASPRADLMAIAQSLWGAGAEFARSCGPLSTAIIRKNESRVREILTGSVDSVDEVNSKGQSPLHLSSAWPRGVEILLETSGKKLVNQPDYDGWLPISYALMNDCFESFHRLLNDNSLLSSHPWIGILPAQEEVLVRVVGDLPGYMRTVVDTLADRRKRLYRLAKESLPTAIWDDLGVLDDRVLDKDAKRIQQILLDLDVKIPEELIIRTTAATVYHWGDISDKFTAEAAEKLFDAGFLDIDVPNEVGLIPLHEACLYRVGRTDLDETLDLIIWYLSKGADPGRRTPAFTEPWKKTFSFVGGVSVSQMVACLVGQDLAATMSSNVSQYLNKLNLQSQTLIEDSVRKCGADACVCGCSEGGCSPVIALLKGLDRVLEKYRNDRSDSFQKRVQELRLVGMGVLNWLDAVLAKTVAGISPDIVQDIIRFETFNALGLTHTCCWGDMRYIWELRRLVRPFETRFQPSEVEEMCEEESDLLEEHQQLVAKFIRAYDERKESLTSFIRGFWRTEMIRVLTTRNPPTAEQIKEMRQIGVVIDSADEAEGPRLFRSAFRHAVDLDSGSREMETELEQDADKHRPCHENGSSEVSDDEWFWVLDNFSME